MLSGAGRLLLTIRFNQFTDTLAHLRAVTHPMVNALKLQQQLRIIATSNRVKETYPLQIPPVTTVAAVRDYNTVEWLLFSPPRERRMVTMKNTRSFKTIEPLII